MTQNEAHREGPALSDRDMLAIHHLVADVSFAFDSADYATKLADVLTDDFVYERPGALVEGRDALVKMLDGMTDPAVSHHTSTVSVHTTGPDTATCRSKVITFRSGGRFSFGEFTDSVTRNPSGPWKVAHRLVRPLGVSAGSDS